ncbi:endonuclease/exonuclease/phosphatase family protein [Microbacterium esteraromaticum]|uniref:Endonuclease/exonuclease/phosphatase family protein n=1 Tax=Microbacterium esteraromaticum TaxID=57043 RepID=A0A939DVQ7_9MICO|nr:endonuclease/exonuclease/phosphatase family protein [Microbacterium esteraromaticum]MBN8205309.1 endonuclease/exonuclease/phosphatase family protein [Microbacterium esteraromaticum]MBN8415463.1 endonuclease/exonuclease/phosphatase family protein [Microbacterium esteraromaticum]MBN8424184.1 endonuclease/exonuclease/phosphatase family protein [Microbacterium esteraromaticum]
MRVISYNLRKHRAARELADLVSAHDPDILCLQECDTQDLPESIGGLSLVEATSGNRLGLAMYLRRNTFRVESVRTIGLKKSLHDMVLKPAHERVLGARLLDIDTGRGVIVASFHAAPLTALNSLRRNQIRAALGELQALGPDLPVLMVGDYNYPVFKENLGQTVREHGYMLTLSDDHTYTRYRVFRGHYDFATSVGLDISKITTLPQGTSDHRPILVTAETA